MVAAARLLHTCTLLPCALPSIALRARMCATGPSSLSQVPARERLSSSGHQGGRSLGKKRKVRQHVNPLQRSHQYELPVTEGWPAELFASPNRPLHVDIGCARGLFCIDLAAAAPELNVLGLEIREVFAEAAAEDAATLGLTNAAFLGCNANVNLPILLRNAAPCCALQSATVQFPDPWFKAKHHKRRVLQPPLVETIAEHLAPGGWLLLSSDVLDVAQEMRAVVRSTSTALVDAVDDVDDWSVRKPAELADVTTERERASADLGRPVYRALFHKRAPSQRQF